MDMLSGSSNRIGSQKESNQKVAKEVNMASYSTVNDQVMKLQNTTQNAAEDMAPSLLWSSPYTAMSVSEIASRFPNAHSEFPQKLQRILRLLCSHSLLTCSSRTNEDGSTERVYGISAVGKYFVPDEDGDNFASFSAFSYCHAVKEICTCNFISAKLTREGIEHVGGDMFASVPNGDAIILKAVCHNWSDEKCVEVLRNCHKALPQDGKVIVVEFILQETPETTGAYKCVSILDSIMFITVGGKERTQKEFESLCKTSGLSKFQVAGLAMNALAVMEFYK
ncbi:hypothetical protein L6164_007298 [Bauhinia variegata]|uniref:Uncharacterized protein n=1 Tax=Bauhinia variegata TaxID=167791 RepID=A0ACB9PDG0_BAUVA|nr:hypothetical protein L6164_007298 [Bauhinia variegata]